MSGLVAKNRAEHGKTLNTAALGAAFVATVGGMAALPAAAQASNPLYCNGYYPTGSGCGRWWPPAHQYNGDTNSARNENGGTVCIQADYVGGWGASHCGYGGTVVTSHLRSPRRSAYSSPFGDCWQGDFGRNELIHCRYSWGNFV